MGLEPSGQPLVWTDGQGREWLLHPRPDCFVLDGEDGFAVLREAYPRDLSVSSAAGEVVIRISGPTHEVGFLVSEGQATELLRRLDYRPDGFTATDPDEEECETPRPVSLLEPPRMTGTCLFALILAALAFIPLLGLGFALASAVLILIQRRRVTGEESWRHVRIMNRVAVALTVLGVGVSLLSTWTWFQPSTTEPEFRVDDPDAEMDYLVVGLAIAGVLVSLSVHEAAHALSAWWCGDNFAQSQGRVTLNPIAHVDPVGTVILPIILAVAQQPVFGWARPTPVRLENVPKPHRANVLVSVAGPGSNLFLAAIFLTVLLGATCILRLAAPGCGFERAADLAFYTRVELSGIPAATAIGWLLTFLRLAVFVNLFLAMLNLLPIPPLDGSHVVEHLFPNSLGRLMVALRPFGFMIFIALIWTQILDWLLAPAIIAVVIIFGLFGWCIAP